MRRETAAAVLPTLFIPVALALLARCAGATKNATTLWEHCSRFHAYEPGIHADLLPWQDAEGISEDLIDRTIGVNTLIARKPGIGFCIQRGQLFVIRGDEATIDRAWPWQAKNLVTYAYALQRLVQRWGPQLPDVEFVLETFDVPSTDLHGAPETQALPDEPGSPWGTPHGRLPVMRHCKTAESPDITIPTFQFYTLDFDRHYLARTDEWNAAHPWEGRRDQAFAAGVTYHRTQKMASTQRQWDGSRHGKEVEMVREQFSLYLDQELKHPGIIYSRGKVNISNWAEYKMVMHVDGISCSSRLHQLLALGSVVLREQSGYYCFYDKLLTEFIHYVPFWRHRPREVEWAYNWVVAHDAAARTMAQRGQDFVRTYLNQAALECYWSLLLREYARLQRFTPGWRRAGGKGGGSRRRLRGGDGAADAAGAGAQLRPLQLTPVADWLAKQEGLVKEWSPTGVADLGRDMVLLPAPPPSAGGTSGPPE
ncbi:hypothetical protein HYH03_018159 [Edaphochlamys debaryana]|uniref:Glycosyl transferase CAP10 domain-containing protein n=1 Tax=Edaphochlamys debaryana TaxID=47281 RepID=A0A836BPP0_9CHLO|nr:hypothetical protein HYH03_018159 [Edaphochlamys debaryana]|eukprot:KAG2482934.1 hypothetical protein HYH03_018159 [Edaphochlamys debaryana]